MILCLIKAMIIVVICQVAVPVILWLVVAEITVDTRFITCLLNIITMSFTPFVEEVPVYMPFDLQSSLALDGLISWQNLSKTYK